VTIKSRNMTKPVLVALIVSILLLGTPAPGSAATYVVQRGDSLYKIAQRYGTSVPALMQQNNLRTSLIYPGQRLVISGSTSGTYRVQPGDSLYLIARRYGVTVSALRQANNMWTDLIYPGQVLAIPGGSYDNPSNISHGLSQSDINLLARLVTAEAGGEPFLGQIAVAATVLNRVEDAKFPNTIKGVIYQVVNGHYQYSPVLDGRIYLPATGTAYRAVEAALNGQDPSHGANGFYNPAKTANRWVRSWPVTARIGNHVFFRSR